MRPDGTLVGTHWGPLSAIGRQPRRGHANEVSVHTPTEPWGSQRLPRTLAAGDPRRTLFRSLLRRAEGVPVAFADGSEGLVADVVLAPLGFDFWAEELAVTVGDGRRRVPFRRVRQINVRPPRILLGSPPILSPPNRAQPVATVGKCADPENGSHRRSNSKVRCVWSH